MTGRADPGQRAAIREMKAQRASKKLTQEELAEVSGVSLRTIQRLEGDHGWSQPGTLNKLEKALGWLQGHMDERAARYNEDAARRANGPDAEAVQKVIRDAKAALDALADEVPDSALPDA